MTVKGLVERLRMSFERSGLPFGSEMKIAIIDG
jgi:hypothetical protein